MGTVFISYRHSDEPNLVQALYERLVRRHGQSGVFKDTGSLTGGQELDDRIFQALRQSFVVVAVIGPNWRGTAGERDRLHDPNDYVRRELELAFRLKLRVLPVVLNDTPLPPREVLPGSISRLRDLNARPLRGAPHFGNDIDALLRDIDLLLPVWRRSRRWAGAALGLALLLVAAFFGLRQLGPKLIGREPEFRNRPLSHWVASIESDSLPTRKRALEAFKDLKGRAASAANTLAGRVSSKDWPIKCDILEALQAMGPSASGVLPAVMAQTTSGEPQVRSRAFQALAHLGREEPQRVLPSLVGALDDTDQSVQQATIIALGELGPAAASTAPRLLEMSKNADLNAVAFVALKQLGREVVPYLALGLEDVDVGVKKTAALVLYGLGADAVAAVPGLIAQLGTPPNVRISIISTLGAIGPGALGAVPSLVEQVQSEPTPLLDAALHALGRIGPAAHPALPTIRPLMDANSTATRLYAAEAYSRIDATDDQSRALLRAGVSRETGSLKVQAARALAGVDRKSFGLAVSVLAQSLTHSQSSVRADAAWALEELGMQASGATAALLSAARDPDPSVRMAVAMALKKVSPTSPVPAMESDSMADFWKERASPDQPIRELLDLLKSTDARDRASAARALSGRGAVVEAIPDLVNALSDTDDSVKRSAATTLGSFGRAASIALPDLQRMFQAADEDMLKVSVALAILGIDREQFSALEPSLVTIARNGDDSTRISAAAVLKISRDRDNRGSSSERSAAIRSSHDESIKALAIKLHDQDPRTRMEAARSLAAQAQSHVSETAEALAELTEALNDSNPQFRGHILQALEGIGPQAEPVVNKLIGMLRTETEPNRLRVIGTLGSIGPSASQALGSLRAIMRKDTRAIMRVFSAVAVVEVGEDSHEPAQILMKILSNRQIDDYSRSAAAWALSDLMPVMTSASQARGRRTLQQVAEARADPVSVTAREVLRALDEAGFPSKGHHTR